MLWTAEQAEQWMRANPGRWLESVTGALWCWTGVTLRRLLPGEGASLGGWPRLPAEAGEFWPPREHWAAEREIREAKILGLKDAMRSRWERYSLLRADSGDASDWGARQQELEELQDMVNTLFRAAPEVDGE